MKLSTNEAVSIPIDAIKWHDGLLLAPVHFEKLAQRHEELVAYHVRAAAPYAWGVRSLKFKRDRIAEGALSVLELEAIMPDGRLVSYRGKPAEGGRGAAAGGQTALTLNVGAEQLRALREGSVARHVVCVVLGAAVDQPAPGSGRDEPAAQFVAPFVQLALESELRPGQEIYLPLAHLVSESQQLKVAPFIPPLLDIAVAAPDGHASLRARAEALRERLAGTESRLVAMVREAAGQSDERFERRERLRNVSSALAQLRALLGLGVVAPAQLYLTLGGMLGPLGMLRELEELDEAGELNQASQDLADYRHDDPESTFVELLRQIGGLLDLLAQRYSTLLFEHDGVSFRRPLGVAELEGWPSTPLSGGEASAPVLLLRLRGLSGAQAQRWLASAVIASAQPLRGVRERRGLGTRRYRVADDGLLHALVEEGGIVPPPQASIEAQGLRSSNSCLLALQIDPELVQAGQALVLQGPVESGPSEIMLLVAREDGAATAASHSGRT
ncbi:type VI secretion system baseplate subunit TssK [Rugamonas sp. DEMB1]|uniref:type VI secretion system baseplate subunit TssK n=1 Tax=Rugamonas sp. DEMB1 TaxID=3039386 RepID=UPI00244A2746|nr:type VI secretion system baseplate subunit TssK [Rugamonas sp. DEMB1]WGG48115.1 type VI secretion system baseplate subunit TssK [Rugamonas sp. DEMB1]